MPKVSETVVSLSLRLKDVLGPVTRVKKKKNKDAESAVEALLSRV